MAARFYAVLTCFFSTPIDTQHASNKRLELTRHERAFFVKLRGRAAQAHL
jgi:hypothetical protein